MKKDGFETRGAGAPAGLHAQRPNRWRRRHEKILFPIESNKAAKLFSGPLAMKPLKWAAVLVGTEKARLKGSFGRRGEACP